MNPLPVLLGLLVGALAMVVMAIGIVLFSVLRLVAWMRKKRRSDDD